MKLKSLDFVKEVQVKDAIHTRVSDGKTSHYFQKEKTTFRVGVLHFPDLNNQTNNKNHLQLVHNYSLTISRYVAVSGDRQSITRLLSLSFSPTISSIPMFTR